MFRYKLKHCVWELTRACTLNCLHCGSKAGKKRESELTLSEALDVAGQLVEMSCEKVVLIGGEITLVPYWDEIARFLAANGVICDIITNGYAKTQEDYEKIRHSNIRAVAVSVDGMNDLHNYIRNKNDAFYQLEKFVDTLKNADITLSAVTTITKQCVKDLPAMALWLKSKGIRAWQWQQVSPMGNAKENKLQSLDKEDIRQILCLYDELTSDRLPITLADNIGYFYNLNGKVIKPFGGCGAGLSVIGIDSAGNIKGCESLYDDCFIEGNVRKDRIADIWNDEHKFSYNRKFDYKNLKGECKTCKNRLVCAAGCRSFNAFSGDLYCNSNCITNQG